MNIYKFYAVARCPVQEQLDIYDAVIHAEEIIPCETIAKAVLKFSATELFQEDLAWELGEILDVEVTLKGMHSGIEITSTGSGGSRPSSSYGGSESS